MARASNWRNSNRIIIKAEKDIASYVLYYDESEISIFLKNFVQTINHSDFKLTKNMEIFIKEITKIYKEFPEILNSTEKSSNQFYIEILTNKIKDLIEIDIASAKEKEDFFVWLDEVEGLANKESSDGSEQFILGDECCHFYYWHAFLNKVDNMNNSSKSYREKLEMKLPDIHNSIESARIKLSDIHETTFERSEYTTGLEELDELVNILPTNLVYVVARPSVGKSMFVVNLGINNALREIPILYISLEMSSSQTKSRILTWIKNDEVNPSEIEEIEKTDEFNKLNEYFNIIDSESSNGELILSYIDNFFRDYPKGIAILDSINLVRFTGEDEWSSLRHISRSLKEVARKRSGIIICCAQASRSSETMGLGMDTLFGSSTLEQDTDIIIGLENSGKDNNMSPLKLKIIKNRDGIKDLDLDIRLQKSTMHFYDSYSSC